MTVEPMASERRPPVRDPDMDEVRAMIFELRFPRDIQRLRQTSPNSQVISRKSWRESTQVPKPQSTVFVGGLAPEMDEGAVRLLFIQFDHLIHTFGDDFWSFPAEGLCWNWLLELDPSALHVSSVTGTVAVLEIVER